MIDYKLAKQLKEAGFPQKLKNGDWIYNEKSNPICLTDVLIIKQDMPYLALMKPIDINASCSYTDKTPPKTIQIMQKLDWKREELYTIKIPTLEELIEACKKSKKVDSLYMGGGTSWYAEARDKFNRAIVMVQSGKDLFEALAKLWLKLNENNSNK